MMDGNQAQLSACSSVAKPTPARNNFEQKEFSILNSIYESLYYELIDEEILEICFEVHKAVKQGKDPEEQSDTLTMEDVGMDVDFDAGVSQSLKPKPQILSATCPLCNEKKSPYVFARHLSFCMGLTQNYCKRKTNSREAIRKIVEALNSDTEEDSDSDTSRKVKKGKWRNSNCKK